MKLEKKRQLMARALNVGINRIVFNTQRLGEIKEAITKQDIRDLKNTDAILIKEKKGARKIKKRKTRRRKGSIKKKVNQKKKDYTTLVRKQRNYAGNLREKGKISTEELKELRKEIRARNFKNLSHMKEHINKKKND